MPKLIIAKKNTATKTYYNVARPTGDEPTITGTPTWELISDAGQAASGNLTSNDPPGGGKGYYASYTTPNSEGMYQLIAHITADGLTCNEEIASVQVVDEDLAGIVDLLTHADYGLAQLVRATTPANTLDVDANNRAKTDIEAIGNDAQSATDLKDFADAGYDPATNKVEGVKTVDTTTTNTDMVGTDNAFLAANAPTNFSDLSITATTGRVDVASIEGTDATDQINAACDTALSDINLDHLIQTASTVNDAGATSSDFDTALTEATNDHYNDMVIVFTSGALAGQARRISDYDGTSKNIIVTPAFTEAPANSDAFIIMSAVYLKVVAERLDTQAKTDVNAEADTALTDYDPPTKTEMDLAFTEIKGATWSSGTDTLEHIRDKETDIETDTAEIGTAGAGLTDLGGMSTTMKAEVNAECDTALSDYDGVVPADLPSNFSDLSITATTGRVDISSIEGSDATDQITDAVEAAVPAEASSLADAKTSLAKAIYTLLSAIGNQEEVSSSNRTIRKDDDTTALLSQNITGTTTKTRARSS